MPSYQFLAVARIQFRQRDIVYFGKQDIGGFPSCTTESLS